MALTPAQLTTLKVDIAANTNQINGVPINTMPNSGDANFAIAKWYSTLASPSWTVWKTTVTITEIGRKFNGSELAGLTTANVQRLTCIALYGTSGINPSLADQRAFFDDVFSGAGGTITRPALLALWKRLALRIEKLFSTGTGTDLAPATMGYEGSVTANDIEMARNS